MITILAPNTQHWIQRVSEDTVFTVFTSISIFALGFALNRLYDWWMERSRIKRIRSLVYVYVSASIPTIQRRIDACRRLSESIASVAQQQFVFMQVALRTDFLSSLPQQDLFRAVTLVRRKHRAAFIVHYNSLLDDFDFLGKQPESAKRQFLDFVSSLNRFDSQWNSSLNSIFRYHDQFMTTAHQRKQQPNDDPFLKTFNKLVHLWNVNKQNTPDDTQTQLVQPLKKLCAAHPADSRIHSILPLVTEALSANSNRNQLLTTTKAYFAEQADRLSEKLARIQSIESALKGTGAAP